MSPVAPGGRNEPAPNEPAPPNERTPPDRPGWDRIPDLLRARGLRWTPQRATLLAALAGERGHVTGSRLVERCREIDPATTPSTVYRTLDLLEALGVISHSHGIDGHEEYSVRPDLDHGHLICSACGTEDELSAADAAPFLEALEARHGFRARVPAAGAGSRVPAVFMPGMLGVAGAPRQ